MPDNDNQNAQGDQQQGRGRGSNRQQRQNSPVRLFLEGKASACNISVNAKPNQRIEFYAGNQGNFLIRKVVDDAGALMFVVTDNQGIATSPQFDLTLYQMLKGFTHLTAITDDGKQSQAVPLPPDLQVRTGPPQAKRLKILSPIDEVIRRHENRFPVTIQTYERPNVVGAQHVIFTADGPVRILGMDGSVLADNVRLWEFDTDARGRHAHDIILLGFTKREVAYQVDGDADMVNRTLEAI